VALRVEQQPLQVRRPTVAYRRILVPVWDASRSAHAVALASRLAAEHGATLTAVGVIEVPAALPLDAQMFDEEAQLKPVLARVTAIGERYGLRVEAEMLRARSAGEAIVDRARESAAEIIVLAARRRLRRRRHSPPFGSTVQFVLQHAPCRVLLAAAPEPR
jgi:basic amino acid/polyamine antiporter, APA family